MLTPLVINRSVAKKIEKIFQEHDNMLFLPAKAVLEAANNGHFFAFSHPLHPLVCYSIRTHDQYWEFGSAYAPGLGILILEDFEKKRKAQNIAYGIAISSVKNIIKSLSQKVNVCGDEFPDIITEERRYTHDGERKMCIIWK